MSRKRWSYRLSRPIPVKDGPTLRTLDDVRIFMLDNLPEEDQARRSWQKACDILSTADLQVRTTERTVGAAAMPERRWQARRRDHRRRDAVRRGAHGDRGCDTEQNQILN